MKPVRAASPMPICEENKDFKDGVITMDKLTSGYVVMLPCKPSV